MSPFEMAARWHAALECGTPFVEVLETHLLTGYVFATPEIFLMGRRVDSRREGMMADFRATDPEGDCWHVWLLAGDFSKAMRFLPFELPYVSFHRRGKLRVMSLAEAGSLLGGEKRTPDIRGEARGGFWTGKEAGSHERPESSEALAPRVGYAGLVIRHK